ncbi:aspartate kinase [Reyranella sp. CPCC 100927]|uniref:aspartate kinase n=1 Tax=Reyranella sp. CPCC 100927 TaxID=2599616 RepID=UPI0011B37D1A|nr:aspartate kinase [Reyranella sp. CPCC 100927]TWT08737.1 aspartate kinase [Reyranella sp. CPCC 100927]
MALIVQKFGGTSVGDIDRIKNVAVKVKKEVEAGHKVAVVVSAMSGVTNQLVGYVDTIAPLYDVREYDVVVSTGEQVTIGLLALALQQIGVKARSFTSWQLPVRTNDAHGKARVDTIGTDEILAAMNDGTVAVVPGFQGVSPEGRVTTLGRGGSDTSALALAAALKADRCDIYTDVDGVYTTDPRITDKARKLPMVTYEEMLEMASLGSKVLQTRSVELAMNHGVRVQVLSTFSEALGSDLPGTLVVDEEEIMAKGLEQSVVSGIAYAKDDVKITVAGVADRPGIAASLFGPLAVANINVDMIVQNVSLDGKATDITFTLPKADLPRAVAELEKCQSNIGFKELKTDTNVAKISVIGVGMRSHAGVALTMFETLAKKGINIEVISTSEIKISVLIEAEYTELAVRALHTAYGLDAA